MPSFSEFAYIRIEGGVVHLIFLECFNVVVESLLDFRITCLIKALRICNVCSVELEIR